MKLSKWILVFVMVGMIVTSCLYRKGYEGEGYALISCDTTNFSYTIDIAPILNTNCVPCHNASYPSSDVVLDSYSEVKKQADNGNLSDVLTGVGYKPVMPPPGSMDPMSIQKIRCWISKGAPSN